MTRAIVRPFVAGLSLVAAGCGDCGFPELSTEVPGTLDTLDRVVREFFSGVELGRVCLSKVRAVEAGGRSRINRLTHGIVVETYPGQASDAFEREVLANLCLAFDLQGRRDGGVPDERFSWAGSHPELDAWPEQRRLRQAFAVSCAFGPSGIALFGHGTCDGRIQRAADAVQDEVYTRTERPTPPVELVEIGRLPVPDARLHTDLGILSHVGGGFTVFLESDDASGIHSFSPRGSGLYEEAWSDAPPLPWLPTAEADVEARGWTRLGNFGVKSVHWDGLDVAPAVSHDFPQGQAVRLLAGEGGEYVPVDVCLPQHDADEGDVGMWSGELFPLEGGRLGAAWIERPGEVTLFEVVRTR